MLGIVAILVAYLVAVLVLNGIYRGIEEERSLMPLAFMGMPSATYVLLSYIIGMKVIPAEYLGIAVISVSLGSLGSNLGRIIMNPALVREVRKDANARGMAIVLNAIIETGAIFTLLIFLLGYMGFGSGEWNTLPTSPDTFVPAMEVMGITSLIGGILVGWVIREAIQRLNEEGKTLREGFRKVFIISAVPQYIWIAGLLVAILIYMGAL